MFCAYTRLSYQVGVYRTIGPLDFNIYSETAWPIKAKFHVESPWEGGRKVHTNGPSHMTNGWRSCPYMVKTFKNLSYRNKGRMIMLFGMEHYVLQALQSQM